MLGRTCHSQQSFQGRTEPEVTLFDLAKSTIDGTPERSDPVRSRWTGPMDFNTTAGAAASGTRFEGGDPRVDRRLATRVNTLTAPVNTSATASSYGPSMQLTADRSQTLNRLRGDQCPTSPTTATTTATRTPTRTPAAVPAATPTPTPWHLSSELLERQVVAWWSVCARVESKREKRHAPVARGSTGTTVAPGRRHSRERTWPT